MWTLAGEEATLTVDLKVDGQFVIADQGSLLVTIRNSEGVAFEDWNKTPLPDSDKSQVSLTIPASLTFLESSEQMGAVYTLLEWKVEGTPYRSQGVVRLARFAPIQATSDGVRNRLGAGEQEIPDSAVDLYEAYFQLLVLYPDTLPSALRSGIAAACLSANNAIELQAALVQLPSLGAKLSQSEAQENTSKTRMKLDLDKLEVSLKALLDKELKSMETTMLGLETLTTVTQILVVIPTDVITGA